MDSDNVAVTAPRSAALPRSLQGNLRVPSQWHITPLKVFLRVRSERQRPDLPLLSVYRDHGVVPFGSVEGNFNKPSLDLDGYRVVRVGDLVLNKMKTWQGSLAVSGLEGLVSPAYIVCRVGETWHGRFLHYLLRSHPYIAEYAALSYGVRPAQWDMRFEDFRLISALEPPLEQQRSIADFLDRETERIDALVAKKQRLIELLQDKRTALISHAVTRGLNPDAPMKDSGSVFLPEMPAHWDSLSLGHLCRKISDGPHYSPKYVEDGILFLSTRNIGADGWHLEDAERISADDFELFCRKVVPKPGDVLYTKGGTTGIARAVDIDEPFQVWVHVAVLKLREEIVNPFFLAYALNGAPCYGQSQLYTRGATNNDLGLTRMIRIKLGLPPMREQLAIVRHLDLETARIDSLVASIKAAGDRLNEYRCALITAAVTGQIDVREYAKEAS